MKCSNCGKEIAEDSLFCEFCGTKISDTNNNPTNKSKIKWAQLILGILVLLIGCYLMFRSGGITGALMVLVIGVGIIVFLALNKKRINK